MFDESSIGIEVASGDVRMERTAPPLRRVYPIREASTLLGGLSRGQLYKMKKRGEIRFAMIGGRAFIPHDEIERLVREAV